MRNSPVARVVARDVSPVPTFTTETSAPAIGTPAAFTEPSSVMVFCAAAGRAGAASAATTSVAATSRR